MQGEETYRNKHASRAWETGKTAAPQAGCPTHVLEESLREGGKKKASRKLKMIGEMGKKKSVECLEVK